MRGFSAFLKKELVEIVRTWRIWVLPGILLFFALTGPIIAIMTPQLLESVGTQPGVVIQIPDPTYVDAYLQWTKNLQQMVTFAVIIIFGGIISSERKAGTAILVLTKPLSRTAFVLAKYVSSAILLTASVVVGTALTWGMTYAVFGEAPATTLAQATGAWLAWGLMLLAIMTVLSVALNSQAGAAGAGLGVFLVLGIAGLWGPALDYSAAGLIGAPTEIVMGQGGELLWPILAAGLKGALALAGAAWLFSHKEL